MYSSRMDRLKKRSLTDPRGFIPLQDIDFGYESERPLVGEIHTGDDFSSTEVKKPQQVDSPTPNRRSRFSIYALKRLERAPTETPKVAFHKGYTRVLWRHTYHAIPFFAALYLIVINFKGHFMGNKPYWMAALLFVTKPLELGMQASIAAILLSYINHTLGVNPDLSIVETPLVIFPMNITDMYKPKARGDFFWALSQMHMPGKAELLKWDFTVTGAQFSRSLNLSLSFENRQFAMAEASLPRAAFSDSMKFADELQDSKYQKRVQSYMSDSMVKSLPALSARALLYQPLVKVQCFANEIRSSSDDKTQIRVPDASGNGYVKLVSVEDLIKLASSPEANSTSLGSTTALWITPPPEFGYSTVLFVAMFEGPNGNQTLMDFVNHTDIQFWSNATLYMTTCGVHASWQQAYYDLGGSLSIPLIHTQVFPRNSRVYKEPIIIHHKFAEELWGQVDDEYTTGYESRYPVLFDKDRFGEPNMLPPIELYVAAAFADALANIQPQFHSYRNEYICNEYNLTTLNNCTLADNIPDNPCPVDFRLDENNCSMVYATVYESGYGYNRDGIAILLSILTLCFYCVTVLAYWISICCRPITCHAWSSPADLVFLALQSRYPEHLGHTSVRIERTDTFREPVGVRANEVEKLELVFENDPQTPLRKLDKVEANKRY
ncbi:hypothetical protein N0V90_003168 [Kalmusia sp. IMI 367209]|nr:hypothetical protein N0V90_003168 [Kalmusia sp. IMI 367209]